MTDLLPISYRDEPEGGIKGSECFSVHSSQLQTNGRMQQQTACYVCMGGLAYEDYL